MDLPAFVVSGVIIWGFLHGHRFARTLWFAECIVAPECDAPGYTRGGKISLSNSQMSLVNITRQLTAQAVRLTALVPGFVLFALHHAGTPGDRDTLRLIAVYRTKPAMERRHPSRFAADRWHTFHRVRGHVIDCKARNFLG